MLWTIFYVVLLVFVLADIISGGPGKFKNLDKIMWVIIVIILPIVGSILWFLVGREYEAGEKIPGFTPPAREKSSSGPRSMSDTEREIAALDREIEAYEKAMRLKALEDEVRAKREKKIEG